MVTPSVSSSSEFLEFLSVVRQIPTDRSVVILEEVSGDRSFRKPIYLILIPLEVTSSEPISLLLLDLHNETRKQIAICNDNCKFVA